MERFNVTYRLFADSEAEATEFAAAIALENTVEIPRDIVPKGYIEDVVLGRVEKVHLTKNFKRDKDPKYLWR